jgi:HPt (histidine-containing phosphotransfer) domain-containing protein
MTDEAIRVVVDPDLLDLIPGYLARRREDVAALITALDAGDLEAVRNIGHSMKGSGGGYGFGGITEIGSALEQAGKSGDTDDASAALAQLTDYLSRVVVIDG